MSHVCGDHCRSIPGLVDAHERSRLSARRKRLAKLHGRRPKVRAVSRDGLRAPVSWMDEVWAELTR